MGFFDKLLGGGEKTPFVSDPAEIARQQELLTRFNIESPEGSRTFTKDEDGREVLNIIETPFQQQQRAEREALASTFLTSLEGGDDRFASESKRIGDVTFERGLSRLEPFIDKRRRRQEVALANQGLPVGSEARTDTLAEIGRDENDRLIALAQTSELAAGQEQSRLRNLSRAEALTFFGGEIGGIDMGAFSSVGNVDRAGIIQKGESQEQARAAQEATRQNTRRSNFIDIGTGIATGGASLLGSGFFGTSAGTPTQFGQGPTQGSGPVGGITKFFGGF